MPAIYGPSSGNCCKKRRYTAVVVLVVDSLSLSVVLLLGPVNFQTFLRVARPPNFVRNRILAGIRSETQTAIGQTLST